MSTPRVHPTPRRHRRRNALYLSGALLALSGTASVSPALASEEPLPGDPSDQIEYPFATCFGQTVDMWVPPGGGTFYGDNNDNVIMGTGGDDTIYGEGGIDRICQPESDRTSGLLGLDPTADDGIDTIHGGGGGDFIDGGTDGDQIYGDVGADVLRGGTENDVLDGGPDNDTLRGEDGDDGLACGSTGVDNDVAYGGPGADFLDPSAPQADCEVFVP